MKKFVKSTYAKVLIIALISLVGLAIYTQAVSATPNAWSSWVTSTGTFGDSSRVQVGGAYQWNPFYRKNVFPSPTINYQTTDGFGVYCTYTGPEMYGYSLMEGREVPLWSTEILDSTGDPKSHQEIVGIQAGINQIKGACNAKFISWLGDKWWRNVTAVVTAP